MGGADAGGATEEEMAGAVEGFSEGSAEGAEEIG